MCIIIVYTQGEDMLLRSLIFIAMLSAGVAHADSKCEPKEQPPQEKKVDKPDVHAPMDKYFLDRRPYMAPKKKSLDK